MNYILYKVKKNKVDKFDVILFSFYTWNPF